MSEVHMLWPLIKTASWAVLMRDYNMYDKWVGRKIIQQITDHNENSTTCSQRDSRPPLS